MYNLLLGSFSKKQILDTITDIDFNFLEIHLDLANDKKYFLNLHSLSIFNITTIYSPKRLFEIFQIVPKDIKDIYPKLFKKISELKDRHDNMLELYLEIYILFENYQYIFTLLSNLNQEAIIHLEESIDVKSDYRSLIEKHETGLGFFYFKLKDLSKLDIQKSSCTIIDGITSNTTTNTIVDIFDIYYNIVNLEEYYVLYIEFKSEKHELTIDTIKRKYLEQLKSIQNMEDRQNWSHESITPAMREGLEGLEGFNDKWDKCENEYFYWDNDKNKCKKRCELLTDQLCDGELKCEFDKGIGCIWKNIEDAENMNLIWERVNDNYIAITAISANSDKRLMDLINSLLRNEITEKIIKGSIGNKIYPDTTISHKFRKYETLWNIMNKSLISECIKVGYKKETIIFNLNILFKLVDKLELEKNYVNRYLYEGLIISNSKEDGLEIEPFKEYWNRYFNFIETHQAELSHMLTDYPIITIENALWMIMTTLDIKSPVSMRFNIEIITNGPNAVVDYWGLGIEQEMNVLLGPFGVTSFTERVNHFIKLFEQVKSLSSIPSTLNPENENYIKNNPDFTKLLRVLPDKLDLMLDNVDVRTTILKNLNVTEFFICASNLESTYSTEFKSTQLVYRILANLFTDLKPEDILSMCYVSSLIEDFIENIYSIDLDKGVKTDSFLREFKIENNSKLDLIDNYIVYLICYISLSYFLNQFKQSQLSVKDNRNGSLYEIISTNNDSSLADIYTNYQYTDDKYIQIVKFMNKPSIRKNGTIYRIPYNDIYTGLELNANDRKFISKYEEAKVFLFSFNSIEFIDNDIDFDHGTKYEVRTNNLIDKEYSEFISFGLNNKTQETIDELDSKKKYIVQNISEFYSVPVFLTDKYTYYKNNILEIRSLYFYRNRELINYRSTLVEVSLKDKPDYSGDIEINLTLPFDINNIDIDKFKSDHIILMKSLQLLSPLFLACWTGVNPDSYGDNHSNPETSFRFIDYAGIRLLATNVDLIYDVPRDDYFVNDKDEDLPNNPDFLQANPLLVNLYKSFKDLSSMDYFPREFSVNRNYNKYNPNKGAYFGFEWKMLDQYPTEFIYPIVLFILLLGEWSLVNSNIDGFGSIIEYYTEHWETIKDFINEIIYEGWNTQITLEFEKFINRLLNLEEIVSLNYNKTCYGYLNKIYNGLFTHWHGQRDKCQFIDKFYPDFMNDDFKLPELPNINKLNNNYMISEIDLPRFISITSDMLGFDIGFMSNEEIKDEIFNMIQKGIHLNEDVIDLYYYLLENTK